MTDPTTQRQVEVTGEAVPSQTPPSAPQRARPQPCRLTFTPNPDTSGPVMPDFRDHAVRRPESVTSEATRVLGTYLRDMIAGNGDSYG